MSKFNIGNRLIGDGYPAFIIAEIGNNHNGDFDMALALIDKAIECKADSVKFQVKNIEKAFPADLLDSPYSGPNSFGSTYREHKQMLEFSHDEYRELKEYSDKKKIIFFATPFDLDSVEFLLSIDVPAFKIASFHITDEELVRTLAKSHKPIIASTGMSSLEEIDRAVSIIREEGTDFALLQCTSSYPTDDKDVHLSVINQLQEKYNCVAGYSGHDRGITIAAASVCFGGKIIEKHFTLDRTLKGPDHAASLEPKGLAGLVERTRLIESAIGSPRKQVLECELKNRKKNRGY
ncbi:MAG TPA: N-acetylneuraminate synthase [Nitrospirae bacterium]|nr:N-acetylneuraminate synthase [Nitrospirota bacterium]